MSKLTVNNVTKSFQRSLVLSEVSFDLKISELLGIFGRNGCGKSTLLKALGARAVPIPRGIDIFFLDEPFVGVDMLTEEKIIQILKKLAAQGKTLLVVHHDLSTVEEYFDKVILLNQRLIAYGDTNNTFTKENIAKAYGGQLPILHKTGMIDG